MNELKELLKLTKINYRNLNKHTQLIKENNMARYIDADKLVVWCNETYQAQSTSSGKAYVNAFLTKVLSCPTANVAPMEVDEAIADTVKKMQERIKAEIDIIPRLGKFAIETPYALCQRCVDQIAKEILEGGDTK